MNINPKLKNIIIEIIKTENHLDDSTGGSGHQSFTSYHLDTIEDPILVEFGGRSGWKLKFTYRIIVETEFTYYPDNPPYEYIYTQEIIVDSYEEDPHLLEKFEREGGRNDEDEDLNLDFIDL